MSDTNDTDTDGYYGEDSDSKSQDFDLSFLDDEESKE